MYAGSGSFVPVVWSLERERVMSAPVQDPIHSSLSDDPDMIDLVEEFVENLKGRVTALDATVADNNLGELARLTHQLKGASGGYGFDLLGEAAAELERSAKAAGTVEDIKDAVEDLISMCNRATAKPAP